MLRWFFCRIHNLYLEIQMISLYLRRIKVVILITVNHIKRESGELVYDFRFMTYDFGRNSKI